MGKQGLFMKWLLAALLAGLLMGCGAGGKADGGSEMKAKEITIQIVGGTAGKHYLIETVTAGLDENGKAVLPEAKLLITDERQEAKIRVHLNTEYTVKVSEAYAKDLDEFFRKKKSGAVLTGPLLKTVTFTPQENTNEFEINLSGIDGST